MEHFKYRQIFHRVLGKFFRKEKTAGQPLPIQKITKTGISAFSHQCRFQNAIETSPSAVVRTKSCKAHAIFLIFTSFYNELHTVAIGNGHRQILPATPAGVETVAQVTKDAVDRRPRRPVWGGR